MELQFFIYATLILGAMSGAMFFLQGLEPTLVDEKQRKILEDAQSYAASEEIETIFLTNRAK